MLRKSYAGANDPAYRYWILTRDREPLVCLSVEGLAHHTDGRQIDLMSIYDETRKASVPGRVGPVVNAIGRDFLP